MSAEERLAELLAEALRNERKAAKAEADAEQEITRQHKRAISARFEPFMHFTEMQEKELRKGSNIQKHKDGLRELKTALEKAHPEDVIDFINSKYHEAIQAADKALAGETKIEKLAQKLPIIGPIEVFLNRMFGNLKIGKVPVGMFAAAALGLGLGTVGLYLSHGLGLIQAATEYFPFGNNKTNSFAGWKAGQTAPGQSAIQTQIQDPAKNDANSAALRQSEQDRVNRVIKGPSSKLDDDKLTANIQCYSMPDGLNDYLNNHLFLPFTTDFLMMNQDFTSQPLQNAPAGDMIAMTFQDGSPATIIKNNNTLKDEKPTTFVEVQFSDGTKGFVDYEKFKAADKAPAAGVNNAAPGPGASNAGPGSPLAYNQNGMTITHGGPNGSPPVVTLQQSHSGNGNNLGLAFGALGVGLVAGGALKGRSGKAASTAAAHPANDHVLHVSEPEMKAGEDVAKAAIKDVGKASKFIGIAKFLGRKAPIIGAFLAAAVAITAVKTQLDHKQYSQAGVEAVNGVVDTVGGVGGFLTGFVADGIHEGIRSVAIRMGGDQFGTLTKSGTREMAEGAVHVAGAVMAAQRPSGAQGAQSPQMAPT